MDATRLAVMFTANQITTHAQAIRKQLECDKPDRGYMLKHAIDIRESIPSLIEKLEAWELTE